MFDARKLERVFFNLILNACEATPGNEGPVTITVRPRARNLKCASRTLAPASLQTFATRFSTHSSVSENPMAPGWAWPFVSKIVQDHSGKVSIEQTSDSGTTLLVSLPYSAQSIYGAADQPSRKKISPQLAYSKYKRPGALLSPLLGDTMMTSF